MGSLKGRGAGAGRAGWGEAAGLLGAGRVSLVFLSLRPLWSACYAHFDILTMTNHLLGRGASTTRLHCSVSYR